MFYKKNMETPGEHSEMYGKQANLFQQTVLDYIHKYNITGLTSVIGSEFLRIEINICQQNKNILTFFPNKTLNRTEMLSTSKDWMEIQFKNYIDTLLLLNIDDNTDWKLGKCVEL